MTTRIFLLNLSLLMAFGLAGAARSEAAVTEQEKCASKSHLVKGRFQWPGVTRMLPRVSIWIPWRLTPNVNRNSSPHGTGREQNRNPRIRRSEVIVVVR